jgi:signal transduction histidine kinase
VEPSEAGGLEAAILAARIREQERIARDLHDGIGQQLTAATLLCHGLEQQLEGPTRAQAERLRRLLEETLDQIGSIARDGQPAELRRDGLGPALARLAGQARDFSGVECTVEVEPEVVVGDSAASELYRIAQEALRNALRHAGAAKVQISLRREPGSLTLRVADDGSGFPPDREVRGLGLRNMQRRAERLGGRLAITRPPGGGTEVACRIPA